MPFRESAGSFLSTHRVAAVAQSVERYLGKVEVGGSIPLGSLKKSVFTRTFLFYKESGPRLPACGALFYVCGHCNIFDVFIKAGER